MMSQVGFLDIGRVLAHVLGQPNREGKVKCFSTTIFFCTVSPTQQNGKVKCFCTSFSI
jgi:hypothetical protein